MTRLNQFYCKHNDGMKLRSGKIINYLGTTEFSKDTVALLKIFDGKPCSSDTKQPKIFRDIVNKGHGTHCTKILAFIEYLNLYRGIINNLVQDGGSTLALRDTTIEKLKTFIDVFENKLNPLNSEEIRHGDCPGHSYNSEYLCYKTMCGCTNITRHLYDQSILFNYSIKGPGYLEEITEQDPVGLFGEELTFTTEVWIRDETISVEVMEENLHDEVTSWRHDLRDIIGDLKRHLSYFQRVPHKIHQDAFFLLSSRNQFSSYIPQDCAKHIISFL